MLRRHRMLSVCLVILVCGFGWGALAATIDVAPGDDLQAVIDGASPGSTINFGAGVYEVDSTLVIGKSLTLSGSGASIQGAAVGALSVFEVSASDVMIQGLDVTWTTVLEVGYASPETADSLIRVVGSGLSGVQILDNTIHVPDQGGAMSTWGARAITVDSNTCAGGITISGNTVYNTRNGIVVRYGNTAVITDNAVYNTKGGIMQYTSSQADADNRTMTGNTWGTVHNEWDIVWNSASYDPDYQASVIALSEANGGAYIVDRRDAAGAHAVGNRSYIFLDPTGGTVAHEAKGNMNEPFGTFALAVEGIAEDGTIYVAAGTYSEGPRIDFDDDVTIIGSGAATTIVTPAGNTGTSGDDRAWFLVDASANLDLSGITFDGSGNKIYQAFRWKGNGSVVDCIFTDLQFDASGPYYNGVAIAAFENGTVDVIGCRFEQIGRVGVLYFGAGVVDAQFMGNTYIGKGDGDWLDYALDISAGAQVDVVLNEIRDNRGVASVDGSESAGILVTDLYGPGTAAWITLNTITDNTIGIAAGYDETDASSVVARYNSIVGNEWGIYSAGPLADAILNWWGDYDGPSGEGTGLGDSVSLNVVYSPWLGSDPDGDPTTAGVQLVSPLLIIVDDLGPAPTGGYMNAAITGANEISGSDLIEVREGSYDASEPITEGVTIYSEDRGTETTELTGTLSLNVSGVMIGVPLKGFTIPGSVSVGAGVDASTIHINWNNVFGTMTNGGDGTLDAQYNFWGTQDETNVVGRLTGDIDYQPFLPYDADNAYDDVVTLLVTGFSESMEQAVGVLWHALDHGSVEAYMAAFQEGIETLHSTGIPVPTIELLPGGAGGAVDGEGGIPVGTPIAGAFEILDPATGEPIEWAAVSFTLMGADHRIFAGGAVAYDPSTGTYSYEIATDGLEPGIYTLLIQTPNGMQTIEIEIVA